MIEEKEIKILLSKEEYDKVVELFKWDKEFIQTNYYYGNSETMDLGKNNKTIRIRKKNKNFFLQIKVPEYKKNSLHIKKEYEEKISNIPDYISKTKLEQLTGFEFEKDVLLFGKLITFRREAKISNNILICLDKNEYLEKTDYEVEIEFNQVYPYEIISILEQMGIETKREIIGKFGRFLQSYKTAY